MKLLCSFLSNDLQLCGQVSTLEKANAHTLDTKDGWLSHVVSRDNIETERELHTLRDVVNGFEHQGYAGDKNEIVAVEFPCIP